MPTGGQLLSLYYGAYFTLLVAWVAYETRTNQTHHDHPGCFHTFAKLPAMGMVLGFWPFLLMAHGIYVLCAWAMRRPTDG
jgi:hypothetical protein